jgi:hypothetical protein
VTQHQGTAHPGARAHLPGQQQQPRIFNPLGGFLNERQLEGVARRETQQAIQPIRQREGEIGRTEAGISQRFGGYANAAQQNLTNLQQQQQSNAQTYENQIAANALRTAGETDTAGQIAATNNGGQVAPEVRAALSLAGNQTAGTAMTQSHLAGNLQQSESNYLTNLRAAAIQRATESQASIPSAFAKQRAGLGQEESKLTAGIPGLASKLGQEQFKDYLTAKGLNVKQGTLALNQQRAATAAQQGAAKIQQTGELGRERNAITARGQTLANNSRERGNQIRESEHNLKTRLLSEKERYDAGRLKLDAMKANGKLPSPKEGRKYMSEIGTAVSVARRYNVKTAKGQKEAREALAAGTATGKGGEAGKVVSQEVISAALNVAVYGRLSRADMVVAEGYGLNASIRPEWFRTK